MVMMMVIIIDENDNGGDGDMIVRTMVKIMMLTHKK